jgi:hypothetical protein
MMKYLSEDANEREIHDIIARHQMKRKQRPFCPMVSLNVKSSRVVPRAVAVRSTLLIHH